MTSLHTDTAAVSGKAEQLPGDGRPPRQLRDHPWARFALVRTGGFLLSAAILIVVTFLIVPLIPGDPAVVAAGEGATAEQIEQTRQTLGLDEPFLVQFWSYIVGVFTLDMGYSFSSGAMVTDVVLTRLPYTAQIALLAISFTLLIGVPAGMCAALLTRGGRNRWIDHSFNLLTSFVYAVPNYVLATFLIFIFAIQLGWFPSGGAESLASLVLPTAAVMIGPTCVIARVVRREAATILEQDYVRTARGWRLGTWRTHSRYVLPNLLTTTLTLAGLILAGMLGGAVVIETVFGWPGLGKGVVDAIIFRDYPVIRAIVLLLGLLATLLIILVDVILAIIDPRNLEKGHNG
ncbi:ABC transporter permease [Enteractinococcus fodinae]|uniref:Peptide/nickel transport system permease protein n=1 Tax=Enteractinococcus fodinae TaxID=684663 RepID=A0ABU2B7Q0_9MICC|nr:ABC transporter permease [Enteractinococcus fodinae]MDR7348414.1 peptide/nickel transport system permease protein [Enteractinococcus fodinae]